MLNWHRNQDKKYDLSSSIGLKEKLYAVIPFGWGALSLFLAGKNKRNIFELYRIFSFSLGSLGSILFVYDHKIIANLIFIIAINLFFISNDLLKNRFEENFIVHFLNASYLGLSLYLYVMTLFPNWFPASNHLWQFIISSAPKTSLMLTLCLLFQNIGYFILGQILFGNRVVKNWFHSHKNLLNLEFIKPQHTNKIYILFIILIIIGSLTRILELLLGGSLLYAAGTVIPSSISSFVSQFSILYSIGWLYGYGISINNLINSKEKSNQLIKLITIVLISLEFIFQLISGSKGRFFTQVFIPLSGVYFLIKKKTTWRLVILFFGVGFLSWLVLYPTLTIYRGTFDNIQYNNFSISNNLQIAFQTIVNMNWNDYLDIILRPINQSGFAEQILALTSIIHNDVILPGERENLWQRLALFWIPRALWPEKPTTLSTNLIGRLSGRLNPENYTTSVLMTGPGEVFIYYGIWGSLLMIIAGLLVRGVNDLISPFKKYLILKVAIFIPFLGLISKIISGAFESIITGILMQIGVLYLLLWLFKKLF